jgi:hypothetical protein
MYIMTTALTRTIVKNNTTAMTALVYLYIYLVCVNCFIKKDERIHVMSDVLSSVYRKYGWKFISLRSCLVHTTCHGRVSCIKIFIHMEDTGTSLFGICNVRQRKTILVQK